MTKPLSFLAALATTVALLALPAGAAAEYLIPDGNSAVNQYTEGIPTGGGEKDTKGAGEKAVKPAKTIGAETTRKLEAKGPEGEALAEVAAETAPPEVAVEGDEPAQKQKRGDAKHKGDKGNAEKNGKADTAQDSEEAQAGAAVTSGSGPDGSSGFGEVLAAATGSSDGGIGLLLPLAIVGAVIWGIVFTVRRRDADETATTHS